MSGDGWEALEPSRHGSVGPARAGLGWRCVEPGWWTNDASGIEAIRETAGTVREYSGGVVTDGAGWYVWRKGMAFPGAGPFPTFRALKEAHP